MHSKRESATKAGPGRYQKQGNQKASSPKRAGGDWYGLHQASAAKRGRRAAIKAAGRRQYLKAVRAYPLPTGLAEAA